MLTGVLLSGAALVGVPLPLVGLLWLGSWRPWVGLGAAVTLAVVGAASNRSEESGADAEARFLTAVAAELGAGMSLRRALVHAASRAPELDLARVVRQADAGAPLERLGASLAEALPVTGDLIGPAVRLAGQSGAAPGATFGRLAVLAAEDLEDARERSVLTAQARMSALVVGALPVVALVLAVVTGRVAMLLAVGPVGTGLMVVGSGLLLLGLAVVLVVTRRMGVL